MGVSDLLMFAYTCMYRIKYKDWDTLILSILVWKFEYVSCYLFMLLETAGWVAWCSIWPRDYKTFFMLNSAEHEICFVYNS